MTQFLFHIFKFLFYSNILISVSAGFFVAGWAKLNGITQWLEYGFLLFFATISIYTLDKLWKIRWVTNKTEWLIWIHKYRVALWFLTLVTGTVGVYILINWIHLKNLYSLLLLLITSCFAVTYSFPNEKYRLRNLPAAKAILIAIVWMSVLGCFPLFNEHLFNSASPLALTGMFLFYLSLTIPFDIRDIRMDENHLKTIPQLFGITKAKKIGLFLIGLQILIAIFNFNTRYFIFSALLYFVLFILIAKAKPESRWLHFACIDACILGHGLIFMLA